MKTKPIFWENKTFLETFQRVSLYTVVSYKFILKSLETFQKFLPIWSYP